MTFLRTLPGTDMKISALGLGTVKIGRNEQVKYPATFSIPEDASVKNLLALARELGINLLDTAPAYGNSEERLGKLIDKREDWVIVTKTGEEFDKGQSRFDFSAKHTRMSVERSLRNLHTDYLDIVLIHSDGNDEAILNDGECVATLLECKAQGLIRAIGMSSKTLQGGLRAVHELDLAMLTWNLQHQDREAVALACAEHKGVLIKKGLMSGHVLDKGRDLIRDSMESIFMQRGIVSMITGTINPEHLQSNVAVARSVLDTFAQSRSSGQ